MKLSTILLSVAVLPIVLAVIALLAVGFWIMIALIWAGAA